METENWQAPSYSANFIQGCKSVASSTTSVIEGATAKNWLAPSYGANFIQGCKSVASGTTAMIEGETDGDGQNIVSLASSNNKILRAGRVLI